METKSYDRVAEMPCYTVVNSYERLPDETGGAYENEATMETGLIRTLAQQGYEYRRDRIASFLICKVDINEIVRLKNEASEKK